MIICCVLPSASRGDYSAHKLELTAAGKMQLLLNGNGDLEIALRNEVGNRWIEKLVEMEREEREVRIGYNKELDGQRSEVLEMHHLQVDLLKRRGMPDASAKAQVRNSNKTLYGALLPDFKSAADAVLVAHGKLAVEDAVKFKEGNKDKMSISYQQLKDERGTVKNVSMYGTRVMASRLKDMKFQAARLMLKNDMLSPAKAHKVVAQHAAENEQWVFRDEEGKR